MGAFQDHAHPLLLEELCGGPVPLHALRDAPAEGPVLVLGNRTYGGEQKTAIPGGWEWDT